MIQEKIIKDQRGTVIIQVSFHNDSLSYGDSNNEKSFCYTVNVGHIAPHKRNENWNNKDIATSQEILEVKMELWNKFKPTI